MSDRFSSLSKQELDSILAKKDSECTNKATKVAMKVFVEYIKNKEKFCRMQIEEMSKQTINEVLFGFYAELRTKTGDLYKKTSMNSIRYGLNRFLKKYWQEKGGIDIVNDREFETSNLMYVSMGKVLKSEGKCEVNHFEAIERSDMKKIELYFKSNLNNPKILQQKVFIDIVLHFGNRGRENLRELKISDFTFSTDSENCEYVFKKDNLSKNHQSDLYSKQAVLYANESKGEMCPLKTLKTYIAMLNTNCEYIFQRINQKGRNMLFDNSPMGVNTIAKMMSNISSAAHLSKNYTNHSLRSTCVTLLNESGESATNIIKITGHASANSLKSYTDKISTSKRKSMCATISDGLYGEHNETIVKKAKVTPSATVTREAFENKKVDDILGNASETTNEFENDGVDNILRNFNFDYNQLTNNSNFQPILKDCNVTINYNFYNSKK